MERTSRTKTVIKSLQEIKQISDFPKKILFIKPSSLGDIFHALPAFYLLKASCPGCQIDWLINKNFAPVLEGIKEDVNKFILFDREALRSGGRLKSIFKLAKVIRKERYDLVIDLQGLIRSALMTLVARAPKKVGFAKPREGISAFAYKKVEIPKQLTHAIEKNVYLVSQALGTEYVIPDYHIPSVKKHKDGVLKVLKGNNVNSSAYIAFAPGARWKTKCWSPQFFADVADEVSSACPDLSIALVGASSDNEIADDIISKCKLSKPVSLTGKTNMCELIEVLREASLLLTNDSGPMHIAAALRTPVFALFGPTDPDKTGPFWQWNKVYQGEGCIKCLKRECKKDTLECQDAIDPKKVANDIVEKYKGLIRKAPTNV